MNTENNKLIAEFRGDIIELKGYGFSPNKNAFFHTDHKGKSTFICRDDGTDNAFMDAWTIAAANMTFHKDWNALMEVVDKIEILGYDSRIEGNNSDGGFMCDFVTEYNEEKASQISYVSKIEAVYNTVIEFIKWYNTQPK